MVFKLFPDPIARTMADGKALQGFALSFPWVFVGFLEVVIGFDRFL